MGMSALSIKIAVLDINHYVDGINQKTLLSASGGTGISRAAAGTPSENVAASAL